MLETTQLTVLHNKNNQSWTQWFLDTKFVKGFRWFIGTNFFDIVCNASCLGIAFTAAIATGGWLPILLAIVTTTILVTSICRTIVDAQVIKRSQENPLQVIAENKPLSNQSSQEGTSPIANLQPPVAKKSNEKLAGYNKAISVLYHSTNLLYVFLIVGLPLIGIGMGMLGAVIPVLACIPPITTAIGGIMFGFRCAICAVTIFSSTKALSSQKLEERKNFILNYQPSENKVSEKKTNHWIDALFKNEQIYRTKQISQRQL